MINKKVIIASSLVTALLASPIAFAETEFDFLLDDLELLEEELNEIESAEMQLNEDLDYEEDPELFPEGVEGEFEPVNIEVTGQDFVRVKVGDWNIALKDVSVDTWFAPYVQDMSSRGIISGYKDEQGNLLGMYGPGDSVTIEQLAKIAVEAAGVDQSVCGIPPSNKSAIERWSEVYISCAEHYGWTVYSDGIVKPTKKATRSEVVTTVLQAFERTFEIGKGDVFKDVTSTMHVRYAIETAAADGIVGGYKDDEGNLTGNFGPYDPVNRAETAKIVSLALQVYGN